LEEFSSDRTKSDKKSSQCKSCKAETRKKYYQRNRDRLLEKNKQWSMENRERKNEAHRQRYQNNPEQYRAKSRAYYAENKERRQRYDKSYYKANKKQALAKATARRLKQKQAVPAWANLTAIKEFYKNCPEGYHVDHIIPLQGETVSGLHVLENLQYLPAEMNRQKWNKTSWNDTRNIKCV
jgi:hypothetical protein